jgi:hypothetical protein
MPNVLQAEPALPACFKCGSKTGPWKGTTDDARWPSGAQKLMCSDEVGCQRRAPVLPARPEEFPPQLQEALRRMSLRGRVVDLDSGEAVAEGGRLLVDPVSPDVAYADAPSIVNEIGWVARTARAILSTEPTGRARGLYLLRKAAVLDRIALEGNPPHDSDELAELSARRVQKHHVPDVPAYPMEAREWVRAQYAALPHDVRHAEGIHPSYAGQEAISHE